MDGCAHHRAEHSELGTVDRWDVVVLFDDVHHSVEFTETFVDTTWSQLSGSHVLEQVVVFGEAGAFKDLVLGNLKQALLSDLLEMADEGIVAKKLEDLFWVVRSECAVRAF